MDFKSLINKITSMDEPIKTVAAPVLPKSVQLNEDAQMRVLAGQTSFVSEAKKKAEEDKTAKKDEKVDEVFDADAKAGDKKKTSSGTATKTEKGLKHEKDFKDDKEKKAKKESIDPVAFKSKFMKMVEAKKDASAEDKKKKEEKKKKVAKIMDEGAKPDFLDMDKDGDKKEPMKKAVADKKKGSAPKKGVNPFAKKTESAMMPKGKKRPVKESVETKLTFKEMIQLVRESGGQQAIDPVDTALFAWAQRVAASKFNESAKAEVYAGLIYERNGGVFEMYDVLSEAQK